MFVMKTHRDIILENVLENGTHSKIIQRLSVTLKLNYTLPSNMSFSEPVNSPSKVRSQRHLANMGYALILNEAYNLWIFYRSVWTSH
jgi:hypothetical protein